MKVKVQRWESSEQVTEAVLRERIESEGLDPYLWSNSPGDIYAAHTHSFHKVIYVVRGSITWILPEEGREIETIAGDRLDLPKGVVHAARVGPNGVACFEAHRV
jgi:quercetin dioxygenase-like cupin family protein